MGSRSAQLITKADGVNRSRALLHLLQQLQPFDFEGITKGDESLTVCCLQRVATKRIVASPCHDVSLHRTYAPLESVLQLV
jgi:hypothetical protein